MNPKELTFKQRLGVVISFVWIISWFFIFSLDSQFKYEGFFLIAITPVILCYLTNWAYDGYKGAKK